MDAAQSLADLTEISTQILAASVVDEEGAVVASTLAVADGGALAAAGRTLLEQAASARNGSEPTQIEAATEDGSVFVLRESGRAIVAITAPRPTVGLVFYDLKNALRSIETRVAKPKRKPRAPRKKKSTDEA